MASLSDLTDKTQKRLTDGFAALANDNPEQYASLPDISVLVQDAADIESQIDIAVDKFGMLTLINMPSFSNKALLSDQVDASIHFIVEIGEEPNIWRDEPLTKPKAKDVAQIVAQLLQGFVIPGYQPLRVLDGDFQKDKKRQIYFVQVETKQIFDLLNV